MGALKPEIDKSRIALSIDQMRKFGSTIWFWSNCMDVYVMATPFLADRRADMKDFKQGTVAKTLGIKVDDEKLHDALYDIEICRAIYDKVCGKY